MEAILASDIPVTRRALHRLPDDRLAWLVARGSDGAFAEIHERYAQALSGPASSSPPGPDGPFVGCEEV